MKMSSKTQIGFLVFTYPPLQGWLAMSGKYTRRAVGITIPVSASMGGSVLSVTVYHS
jgi:hypothetical protein